MTERESFWSAIKAGPENHLARLAFADWLDERGEPDLAFALRWSGFRQKYPEVTERLKWAKWEKGSVSKTGEFIDTGRLMEHIHVASGTVTMSRRTMNVLPAPVYSLIPRASRLFGRKPKKKLFGEMPNGGHRTVEDAFDALAAALKRLRDLLAFTDPR